MDTFIDLHSSISCIGSFMFGKKFEDVFRMERHLLLPKLLGRISKDFYAENCVYSNEPLRSGSARRYVCWFIADFIPHLLPDLHPSHHFLSCFPFLEWSHFLPFNPRSSIDIDSLFQETLDSFSFDMWERFIAFGFLTRLVLFLWLVFLCIFSWAVYTNSDSSFSQQIHGINTLRHQQLLYSWSQSSWLLR